MANIQLRNLSKSYGIVDVIKGFDLDIKQGENMGFIALFGCRKSTICTSFPDLRLLHMVICSIDDAHINNVIPSKRGIAMVF